MSEVILSHMENHIYNQINDYKEKKLFKLHTPVKKHDKVNNEYTVKINIDYKDVLFLVGLKYQSNEIEFLSDISMNHKNFEDLTEIYQFMRHISEIDKNYLKRKFEFNNRSKF